MQRSDPPILLYQNQFAPQFNAIVKNSINTKQPVSLSDVLNLIYTLYGQYNGLISIIQSGNSFIINLVFVHNGLYVSYTPGNIVSNCQLYNSIFYDILATNNNKFMPWTANNPNDPTPQQIITFASNYYKELQNNKLNQPAAINLINSLKLKGCSTTINTPNSNYFTINTTFTDIGIFVNNQVTSISNTPIYNIIVYNILSYTVPPI